jgi:hypothetical protein
MTDTAIPVRMDDYALWEAVERRGLDNELWVQAEGGSDTGWLYYSVESLTARTDPTRDAHIVVIELRGPVPTVACDCEAAVLGQRICCHAALALRDADWFPMHLTWTCQDCQRVFDDAHTLTAHRVTAHAGQVRQIVAVPDQGATLLLGTRAARERAVAG